jgi:hypothetical protein
MMKKITFVECLVALTFAVPAFAAWQCTPVSVLDEQGNVTGTDYNCTNSVTVVTNQTVSLEEIKRKIDNRVLAKDNKVVENTRDAERNAAELARIQEDLASLRAVKQAIKNATGIE